MSAKDSDLLVDVAKYYSQKLTEHGDTPRGVDWNGEDGQIIRFDQLCKVLRAEGDAFSLADIGCGYGALFDYLSAKDIKFSYLGLDVSEEMIDRARSRNPSSQDARFLVASQPDVVSDYSVASGIFNVRLSRTDDEWLSYLVATLDLMNQHSRHGFAFNCLTSYSDEDKKRDYLYYADPCMIFDMCKRKYSKQVALLHDYGLYEFTIIVRKFS